MVQQTLSSAVKQAHFALQKEKGNLKLNLAMLAIPTIFTHSAAVH